MPARVRRLLLAVLVGLVSAACSKHSSSSGDPPSLQERFAHPCQFLPKADAQQVLGQVERGAVAVEGAFRDRFQTDAVQFFGDAVVELARRPRLARLTRRSFGASLRAATLKSLRAAAATKRSRAWSTVAPSFD